MMKGEMEQKKKEGFFCKEGIRKQDDYQSEGVMDQRGYWLIHWEK